MDNKINQYEDMNELIAIVHRNEKRRMVSMILWVALAFLFGSALTFWAVDAYNKSKKLNNLPLSKWKIEGLNNDTLNIGVSTLHGKFKGEIPQNYRVRVFVESLGLYYPMMGEVEFNKNNGEWVFENFNIGFPGDCYIIIGALREDLSEKFDKRMLSGNFRAFNIDELENMTIVNSTKIHVKPKNTNFQ